MPDATSLIMFMTATLALNLSPGPDMLYVIARSVGQGQKAGVISALGVGGGCLAHTFAAAFGLSALLMSSAVAYDLVKYAGAVYLVYLGVRALPGKARLQERSEAPPASLSGIFYQGVVTNVLNPKVALFFLAYLPQFTKAGRGSIAWQIIFLGLLFKRLDFEPAPLVLAFVLGPMLETALRRSLILSDGSFHIFLTRPISAAFILFTLAALAAPLLLRVRLGFGLAKED